MPKKKSSKTVKPVVEVEVPSPATKEPTLAGKKTKDDIDASASPATKKPTPAVKKPKDEIDEIFAVKKAKKREREKVEKQAQEEDSKAKKMKRKKKDMSLGDDDVSGPSRPRRRTNDGLAIYSAEELGISKGDAGGTPLCPFDCSCCF